MVERWTPPPVDWPAPVRLPSAGGGGGGRQKYTKADYELGQLLIKDNISSRLFNIYGGLSKSSAFEEASVKTKEKMLAEA